MPRLRWVPSCVGVLALGLAGCAVVPPQGAASRGTEAGPGAALAALADPECRAMAGQRARLLAVHTALAREGMALRVLGCPQLPGAAGAATGAQVIAAAVLVVDGERAAAAVRGPLADGELLDMGSAAPQAASGRLQRVSTASLAQPRKDSLSPDVLYNRAWLRKLMAAQGLRPVADVWWAFSPR
ncbi:MAG: hypothetical protein ABWY08_13235 [Comamonas sp.]